MPPSSIRLASTLLLTCSILQSACAPAPSEPEQDEGEGLSESASALTSRASAVDTTTKLGVTGAASAFTAVSAPSKLNADLSVLGAVALTPSLDFSGLESAHPWVVQISGTGGLDCRGVLIHPSWVLTAGHCIGTIAGSVSYARTDPTTGVTTQDSRSFDVNGPHRGMFLHPAFRLDSGFGQPLNDIALIRLQTPFTLDRNIQTVALPRSAAIAGRSGTITTHNHVAQPAGYTALFRTPQLAAAACSTPTGFVCIAPPAGSLCKGDSGSGFVELLDGRATVVGITSNVSGGDDCIGVNGRAQLSDVFNYRSWILTTMGKTQEQVAGRVRVRWSGYASSGIMRLTCIATNGAPIEVPMNVPGGELSMDCDDASVVCQPEASAYFMSGFSMRSVSADGGSVTVSQLPYLSGWTAAYADPGSAFQEYTCAVGQQGSVVATQNTQLAF